MAGKTNYFLKVAAALFAVGLLAKLLRESLRRPKNASSDTSEGRQQHMREVRFVDGEERTEGITEREDELGVQRTEEELRAGTHERSGPSSCAYHPTARKQRHRREAPAGKPRCPVAAYKDAGESGLRAAELRQLLIVFRACPNRGPEGAPFDFRTGLRPLRSVAAGGACDRASQCHPCRGYGPLR
jgi:hypothetical protein